MSAPGGGAADALSKQSVIVRVAALDAIIADAKYLAEIAGQKDQAEQVEKYLKSLTGEKGLEGLDIKKPMGAYAKISPRGFDSEVLVLLPIADQKAFLDFLAKVNLAPEKDGDSYKLALPGSPVPTYFAFANGYMYATILDATLLQKEKLIAPSVLFAPAEMSTLSLTINGDGIPDEIKKVALGFIGNALGEEKKKISPSATPAQKKLGIAVLDNLGDTIKMVIEQGAASTVRFDVDRTAGDINVVASFAGKPQSKLAANIASWTNLKGIGASLATDKAAFAASLNVALPENLRKLAEPVIDELVKKVIADTPDANARPFVEKLAKVVAPTLKSGKLNAGFSIIGPHADGKYSVVAGLEVKDGTAIDTTVKDILKQMPPDVNDKIKVDFSKAGGVNIHRIQEEPGADPEAKKLLGDLAVYVGFRKDALLLATGISGLDTMKAGATAESKAGKLFQAQLAIAQLAPLMVRDNKAAPEVAKKVFDKSGNDRVSLTVDGGKALTVRLSAKAQILKFGVLLDEAKK